MKKVLFSKTGKQSKEVRARLIEQYAQEFLEEIDEELNIADLADYVEGNLGEGELTSNEIKYLESLID